MADLGFPSITRASQTIASQPAGYDVRAECLTVTVEPDLSPVGRKAGSLALPTITFNEPLNPDHHSETGSRVELHLKHGVEVALAA